MKRIPLTQGKYAIVDDEDYNALSRYKWYFNKGYVVRGVRFGKVTKRISMHRFINRTPKGVLTDHINGDTLDNRRLNLRSCTPSENGLNTKLFANNTSGFRGVYWHTQDKRWRAKIKLHGRTIFVGNYRDKADAIKARIEVEKKLLGNFQILHRHRG